uniref:Uncharacterized protein n=1 Tax=Ditylenchus dipsaci TaxID=166011 RepID=A0A915CQG5_9BILA
MELQTFHSFYRLKALFSHFQIEPYRSGKGRKHEKLIRNNVAKIVASRVGNIGIFPNPGRRAAHALKLVVLSRLIASCIKDKGPTMINLAHIEELKLPPKMLSVIRAEFFGASRNFRGQMKINLNPTEKSRLIAHFLCMILLFDEPDFTVPISPLSVELNIGELTSVKLLQGLGCTITQCTAEQAILHNSLRMARLTGPPEKGGLKRFKFGKK